MTITQCSYQHLNDNYTLVHCHFDVGEPRNIRCVKTEELLIDSSVFIGLNFSKALYIDTTKVPKIIKQIKLQDLFEEEIEEKEIIQLGLF